MSEFSQIQRQIRILQILGSGRRITTKELLQRFEGNVSRRTLQRDLQSLSASGIPLTSQKTKANENAWSIMSRFRSFIPIPLETNEYLAAYILKSNLKVFQHTPFDNEIQSLLTKIEQLVPHDVFLEIYEGKAETIYENYTVGTFDYSAFGNIINNIITAIREKKKCIVSYTSLDANQPKTYPIEPEKLFYYTGKLYSIIYIRTHDDFITLAIDRINELKVLEDRFPDDHTFDQTKFKESKFGLFPEKPEKVVLKFSSNIVTHIKGRQWHSSQVEKLDHEGNLILTMQVGITPELITWVLGWGAYVKAIAPNRLIREITDTAESMLKIYKP